MKIYKSSMALSILFGCSSGSGSGFGGGGGVDTSGANTQDLPVSELYWEIRDRGLDLISSDGLLYASTQAGGAILTLDPETGDEDKLAWDLGDIQGIGINQSEIHAAFTDSHVEGWVGRIDPPKGVEILASSTDVGALFRSPSALAYGDAGEIYVLDSKAESVWRIDDEGAVTTYFELGGIALAYQNGALYVGGDDGVFEVTTNGATQIDSRPAFGLEVLNGELIASNTSEFVFLVGGPQLATGNLGRPGPMTFVNGTLYIMDTISGDVSMVQLN